MLLSRLHQRLPELCCHAQHVLWTEVVNVVPLWLWEGIALLLAHSGGGFSHMLIGDVLQMRSYWSGVFLPCFADQRLV